MTPIGENASERFLIIRPGDGSLGELNKLMSTGWTATNTSGADGWVLVRVVLRAPFVPGASKVKAKPM